MTDKTIIGLVIAALIICGIIIIILMIRNAIRRGLRKLNNTLGDVKGVVNALHEMKDEGAFEEPKSIGGATSIYLPQILKDFPQFHNSDAESEIKQVIENYLYYRYGKSQKFESNLVNMELFQNLKKESSYDVSNIKFNAISIYGYKKSREYATIDYKCSVGFDCNAKRVETRYAIKYTCQLSDHEIVSKAMVCPNCGAPLNNTVSDNCPYCGAKVIKDTIMGWSVTEITQN